MRKSLTAAGMIAALSLAVPAVAFSGGHQGDRHQGMQRMADTLDLSDAQQEQFKQIHRKARPTMQKLRDAMQDNREAMQKLDPASEGYMRQVSRLAAEKGSLVEQMVKARAGLRAEVAAILTPEQQDKAQKMKSERKHHGRPGRGERRGGGPGDRGPGPDGEAN